MAVLHSSSGFCSHWVLFSANIFQIIFTKPETELHKKMLSRKSTVFVWHAAFCFWWDLKKKKEANNCWLLTEEFGQITSLVTAGISVPGKAVLQDKPQRINPEIVFFWSFLISRAAVSHGKRSVSNDWPYLSNGPWLLFEYAVPRATFMVGVLEKHLHPYIFMEYS